MERKRQLQKREFGKRFSLDSSLVEYMDSNKYIEHLVTQLEEQRWNLWREKLSVARLQREVARNKSEGTMRERLIHELEEERHLRLESEKRLREVTLESERSRAQMHGLQQQFSRMEETVRNLLQNQGPTDQNGERTVDIMKVYQEKLSEDKNHKETMEDVHTTADEGSRSESSSAEEEKEKTKLLLQRLKALEAENSALALENENQRQQYERCLDEVANQVVQALLTQKDLREECIKLKTRVFDLEQQNRTLSVLFQQRVKPASDLLLQECQQNVKAGIPALKCQSQLNITGSSRLYPRSSCSSSELSLSSACSEYSSGSSYTWNDGKTCSKRSSISWDQRISIGSSFPSNLSSPADDLPPTRIKENHILEGLKKLQKRKILLESPSVISKWGYKDCMDSNEGIYSPGIKCGSHKEQVHCKPVEIGSICIEHNKAFTYDSDSHDDADDESSSLLLLREIPSKDCQIYCNKLTHSISDSLFGWEPNRKHLLDRGSYFNSKERPEKLTSFVNGLQLEVKSCTNVKLDQSLANMGWKDLNLQLSDTDDNEVLDELHIESSDEKSPSDLLLTPFADRHTKSSDMLSRMESSQCISTDKEKKQESAQMDIRPKTCNFIKQEKVIKKTSSEECITVIFDAEDGEPIEFNSHQTGVVTVTRNEISINQSQTGPSAEYIELIPQGITNLQTGTDARNHTVLETPDEVTEKKTVQDNVGNKNTAVPTTCSESLHFGRVMLQNTLRQKLVKPVCTTSCKANSISTGHAGINQKQNLSKIPSRGKFSPQKTKMTDSEENTMASSAGSTTLEKSPAFPPVKLPRFKKAQSPTHHSDSKIESHPSHSLQHPQIPGRSDWTRNPKSQVPGSPLLPQRLLEPNDYGEPPTRDVHSGLAAIGSQSPSPPPPPDRSTSLLVRPNYEHSPPLSMKPGAPAPGEPAKNVLKSSPLKGNANPAFHNQSNPEMQARKASTETKPELAHLPENSEMSAQAKCTSQQSHSSPGTSQGPSKVFTKRAFPKTSNQVASCSNRELSSPGSQTTKPFSLACMPLETNSSQSAHSGRKGLSNSSGASQQQKIPNSPPTSPQCHTANISEPFLSQVNHFPLSTSFHGSDTSNAAQSSHEKEVKTRLPVGLKLLVKSPQLLRKSSTVPGKQEKDSINAASKSSVSSSKYKPEESQCRTATDTTGTELKVSKHGMEIKDNFAVGLGTDTLSPHSPENCSLVERGDGLENKVFKRSISSSNKSYLKPALGMNGAKARSQSFSIHTGEKASTPLTEGLGKVRTQIITNTSERGNSLTRQNSTTDGSQTKATPGPAVTSETLSSTSKALEMSYGRQSSHGNTSNCSSQHGSPSKLPFRTSPKGDLFHCISKCEGNKSPSQKDTLGVSIHTEKSSDSAKPQPLNKKRAMQTELELEPAPTFSSEQIPSLQNTQYPRKLEAAKSQRQQTSLKLSEAPEQVTSALSSPVLQPTIEEKVMLCIQENVQKGQGQNKSPTSETKQKTGPSLASWFGFRKSKLPALSSRKTEAPKTKVEKKDSKGSTLGNKQAKLEKKKDKKKTEQHCEAENEFNRKTENGNILDDVLKGRKNTKPSQDALSQIRCEQKNSSSTIPYSAKDGFMKELLNRVDKKAAQQTESGSNNVSYRSVSKGSSQGSSLPSNSISTQGSHKKNSKTKADMEMQNQTLTKDVTENQHEDEEDIMTNKTCQSHVIESCCQMRTLDSGIGTFPLPDSGNRSTARHVSKQESTLETEVFTSPEEVLPSAPSVKAKTLEREVPSTAKSQGSVESIISHSTSDPTMTAKNIRPFQSRLPKPASSGMINLTKQDGQEQSSVSSASLEQTEKPVETKKILPDWTSKKTTKSKDRTLRVCTYSASSNSDTETETEYETNEFGTEEEKLVELTQNNKQVEQEERSVRKSFIGNPMSILDLYQHSLYGHYGEDGPEQLTHYSFIEQLSGTSSKDGKNKDIPSKLKQTEETEEDSENRLSKISLESLNKFNSNNMILLEKEKNCLNKVEGQKEVNGKNEDASLNSSDRHGVDNLESLSDSLYDSFSSCASQGSNDV